MLRESSCTTWGPSAAPFKYPTLEPKTNSATASSFSNCGETKSSLVPIGSGASLMPVPKSPTTANGVNSIAVPSASLAQENLSPLATTDGTTVQHQLTEADTILEIIEEGEEDGSGRDRPLLLQN